MSNSKNTESVLHENQFDNELSLIDLITFFRDNIKTILGGCFLGAALALALFFTISPQWQADALIRVGQLGRIDNAGNGNSVAIEPVLQVADRIKSQSFQNDVLLKLGLLADESKSGLFRSSLKVKLEKSELISLNIRGKTAEDARLHLITVINQLKIAHEKISAPVVNRWRQELSALDLELMQSKNESDRLRKLVNASIGANGSNFSQIALASNILISREAEMRELLESKRVLEARLSPERTFATNILGQVEVSSGPVSPNKRIYILAGLLLGLIAGVALSIFKRINFRKIAN